MGSLPRPPRLCPAEIAERYAAGESRGLLGLRAGVGDSVIVQILRDAGVELRSAGESKRLSVAARKATRERQGRRRHRAA